MIVVVTSVVLWLSWSHRWCYGGRGSIGGVMIVAVSFEVLWCRCSIGGVVVVVVASVVL